MAHRAKEVAQPHMPRRAPSQQLLRGHRVFLLGVLDIADDGLVEGIDDLVEVRALHANIEINAKAFPPVAVRTGIAKVGSCIEALLHDANIGHGVRNGKQTAKLALCGLLD